MYVNEAKVLSKPVRWCYLSDCYRYERPQKGRYRQFWQFGAEQIGADTPAGEAEIVLLAYELLKATGVRFTLHIGHLAPMKHLLSDLSDTDKKTVMAILDKKNFDDLKVCLENINAESLYESLKALLDCRKIDEALKICGNMPDKERMTELISILDSQNIDYQLNLGIVRGLDYYTGMVFEGFADNLGAENQIIGGGSYRLAHLFGGDDVASCGFGIGFDRVMVSLGEFRPKSSPLVAVVYTPDVSGHAFLVAKQFRDAGINTELNLLERGIGAQMKHAAKTADYALVIGKRESESGTVTLKDMTSGEQKEVTVDAAISDISLSEVK
jgi:histidyl-tRNA synthetase